MMEEWSRVTRAKVLQTETEGRGYYAWMVRQVRIGGQTIAVHTKPGVFGFDGLDPATALLAERLPVEENDRVLCLQCGDGLIGVVAAALAMGGEVQLADSNFVAGQAARRTLAANQADNAFVHLSNGTRSLPQKGPFDLVTVRLPKGKYQARQFMWDAFQALRVGGRFMIAGSKREGMKSHLKMVDHLFGEAAVIAYRKGHRLGAAEKESSEPATGHVFFADWSPQEDLHRFSIQVRGATYEVCSRPGIFSWDRLDPGSHLLIEAMEISPTDYILDLGCGFGIVGTVAAALAPQGWAWLVDAEVDAVEAAQATLAANQLANAEARLSDCASALGDESCDVVVTNPPFHQGEATTYAVARQFIRDAARVLKPGGRLFLVTNRFIPYEAQIEAAFGNVVEVVADGRYKVLKANR